MHSITTFLVFFCIKWDGAELGEGSLVLTKCNDEAWYMFCPWCGVSILVIAAYCVVAKETVSKQISIAFLERMKADFKKRYGGGKADTAVAKSLNKEFGYYSLLKRHQLQAYQCTHKCAKERRMFCHLNFNCPWKSTDVNDSFLALCPNLSGQLWKSIWSILLTMLKR